MITINAGIINMTIIRIVWFKILYLLAQPMGLNVLIKNHALHTQVLRVANKAEMAIVFGLNH